MWYSADAIPFSESTNAGAAPVAIPSLSATRTPGMTAKLEHTKHTNWTGGGGVVEEDIARAQYVLTK